MAHISTAMLMPTTRMLQNMMIHHHHPPLHIICTMVRIIPRRRQQQSSTTNETFRFVHSFRANTIHTNLPTCSVSFPCPTVPTTQHPKNSDFYQPKNSTPISTLSPCPLPSEPSHYKISFVGHRAPAHTVSHTPPPHIRPHPRQCPALAHPCSPQFSHIPPCPSSPMSFVAPLPLRTHRRTTPLSHFGRRPRFRSHHRPISSHLVSQNHPSTHNLTSSPSQSPPTDHPPSSIAHQSLHLLEWPLITDYVLRYASTPQGRHALGTPSALHIPSTQHQSELLLARTRAAYHLEYVLSISLDFSGVRDVSETVDFATKARILTGPQLINIATTLYSARQIRRQIDSAAQPCPAKLDPLSQLVSSFRTWPDVEQQITNHLDDYGQVQESADPELRGIRRSIQDTTAEIRAKLNDLMSKHTDAIQNRIITSRYDRYVIPVKVTHKAVFRRGIVHDMSSTGSTVYVEPMSIKSMNDRLRQLTAQEKARVNAILKKLTLTFVAPIADDVKHLQTLLGELDAAVARARCSRSLDACDVVFDNDRPLSLLGARHPLLAWRAIADSKSHKSGKPDDTANYSSTNSQLHPESEWKRHVVPTDYVLSEDIRCVCITGPNTGGKTLSLKTLGVCALMAKTGLFVPCTPPTLTEALPLMNRNQAAKDEACPVTRIPFFDTVLADIGDDQSLVQSLSTFSGHVRRIKRILAAATPQTLVLLDEIGSGTDPAEGAALGMAVLRHLTLGQRAALTFATTHHGELKTMKYIADDSARFFENASVEFDDVKMAPTYKLVWGVPGRSNALAIAERLGMDYDVIEEARFLLTGTSESDDGSKRVDIEKMISSLERDKIAADSAREESERTLQKIDAMKVELEERLERLRQSESNLRKEQRQVMDAELQQARKQIAKVIKDMQQGGGSAQGAAKASEKLRTMVVPGSTPNSSSQGENQASPIENANELNAGDRVIVSRLGANEVEVVDVVSKKEVLVALGAMKVKVKVKEIAKVNNLTASRSEVRESRAAPQQELGRQQLSVRTAANTVDVRGDRVNGAEAKVDRALDKALAIGSLWVIHGHGTGRLRRGIRNFLLSHPHVERIEDAEQSDGGTGVTVAYLS